MSVTSPRGFLASGVAAGFKASGRADLGLLVSTEPARAAGLFTRNAFAAAPVVLTRRHLAGGALRAVVVNSGQANAGTGAAGLEDAEAQASLVAAAVGCAPGEVAVCSTGVIGPRVPMEVFEARLPEAVASLSSEGGPAFARAILTTDTRPKEACVEGPGFLVGGCVKGAGMIAPDLATMLAFLTTDAPATPELLRAVLAEEVAPVWNSVTVDGCPSTNDTVLLLANGAARGDSIAPGGPRARAFGEAIREACERLVLELVRDAEGASRAIVVQVEGARSREDAARVARGVAGSLLVKTAVFGGDPNAGRILQAVGAAGAPMDPAAVSASIGGVQVIREGAVIPFDREAARRALEKPEVVIRVGLSGGPGAATAFGCDLGYEYVRINAEYTT